MKQRPILFSTPMVQAIMEGRKTQTRRVVDLPESMLPLGEKTHSYLSVDGHYVIDNGIGLYIDKIKYKYGKPGDILWVRETHCLMYHDIETGERAYSYKADDDPVFSPGSRWKPSIHMPKVAARIFLQIKSIRVERLQAISEEDAKAEGIQFHFEELFQELRYRDYNPKLQKGYGDPNIDYPTWREAKSSFQSLWGLINGQESWDCNPWVWVIEFERIEKPANFLTAEKKHFPILEAARESYKNQKP